MRLPLAFDRSRREPGTGPAPARSVSSLRVSIWLAGVFFLSFIYFVPHTDWGQSARLDLTMSIVNHRSLNIDAYWQNTGDADFFEGHHYITKAPGLSLLGVPVYLAYKGVLALEGRAPGDDPGDPWVQYLVTIYTVALPSTLTLLLFFWLLGYFSPSLASRAILTLALGLATNVFSYAQNLYAHVQVGGLLLAGFALVYVLSHPERREDQVTRWSAAHPQAAVYLAGLALGLAVFLEYQPLLIALLIGLYALLHLPRRLWLPLAVGAEIPILAVLAYNAAVYHNILVFGYTSGASIAFQHQLSQGVGGFNWPPHLDAWYGMSFSPYRGLFFLSPFLLLAVPGYRLWARGGGREWRLFLAIPIVFFFAISMYAVWYGGTAVGPRLLIPALPFLAFPIIFVLDRARSRSERALVYLLIALSALCVWAETVGGATFYPHDLNYNPLFTRSLPAIAQGNIALNKGMVFGLTGVASLIPLAVALMLWSGVGLLPLFAAASAPDLRSREPQSPSRLNQ